MEDEIQPFMVNGPTTFNQSQVDIAALDGGGIAYVWQDLEGTSSTVIRIFGADGTPVTGTIELLAREVSLDDEGFEIASTFASGAEVTPVAGGGMIVTYQEIFENSQENIRDNDVLAQRLSPTGTAIGEPILVNDDNGDGRPPPSSVSPEQFDGGPSAAALEGGNVLVTWTTRSSAEEGFSVIGRVLGPSGEALTEEFPLLEAERDRIEVGLPGGGFAVAATTDGFFEGSSFFPTATAIQRYEADGTPTGPQIALTEFGVTGLVPFADGSMMALGFALGGPPLAQRIAADGSLDGPSIALLDAGSFAFSLEDFRIWSVTGEPTPDGEAFVLGYVAQPNGADPGLETINFGVFDKTGAPLDGYTGGAAGGTLTTGGGTLAWNAGRDWSGIIDLAFLDSEEPTLAAGWVDGARPFSIQGLTLPIDAGGTEFEAVNDAMVLVRRNETETIRVLANDLVPDVDDLTITIEQDGQFGTARVSGTAIEYTPNRAVTVGPDSFTYRIEDSAGRSDTATVSVEIGPDFAILGAPVARVVEGGAVGSVAGLWARGDRIFVSQAVENTGAGEAQQPEIAIELFKRSDDGFAPVVPSLVQFLLPDGPIERPVALDGDVRETTVGYTIGLGDVFFDLVAPGEYLLGARVNLRDSLADPTNETFQPESDLTDNVSSPDAYVPIVVTRDTLAEIAADAVGEVFSGTALDDLLLIDGQPNGRSMDGGEGFDAAFFRDVFRDDNLQLEALLLGARSGSPDAVGSLSNGAGVVLTDLETDRSDTLIGFERITLQNGSFLFDVPGDDVPFTYRLYSAAFARTPDEPGLRFWNDARNDGLGDRALSRAFVNSPEFAEKFGADPTDEAFIEALYGNVLLREPDADGEAFWLDAFSSGALDRVDMLLAFSESAENVTRNEENYDDGVWVL